MPPRVGRLDAGIAPSNDGADADADDGDGDGARVIATTRVSSSHMTR